jgi:predicted NBD/HSP70 family sugar kinase
VSGAAVDPDPIWEAMPSVRGVALDSVRRENLATVLRLVHHGAAAGRSRSELARITGLNRSTISDLVSELGERRLVAVNEPTRRTGVGRPSPIVTAAETAVAVAVNPEIDAITVAAVALGGRVLGRQSMAVNETISAADAVAIAAASIKALSRSLSPSQRIAGVGVAVPGLVRTSDGMVRLAPHFGWMEQPFAAMLAGATGLRVEAANDATLGVRAESTFGAGRGMRDVIYLHGGASGIGGGVISGGVLLNGAAGYAGELGHTLVRSDGAHCHCGASGCLETEVRRAPLLALAGIDDAEAGDLGARLAAARTGKLRAEIDRQLDYLAVALRNAINILNPRVIILGGFLADLYGASAGRLDAQIARQPLAASREGVTVTRAQLGADILLVGAAELAFADLLADPALFAPAA